jgi:hypothetical protein
MIKIDAEQKKIVFTLHNSALKYYWPTCTLLGPFPFLGTNSELFALILLSRLHSGKWQREHFFEMSLALGRTWLLCYCPCQDGSSEPDELILVSVALSDKDYISRCPVVPLLYHPGLPGVLRHSVKLYGLYPRIHRWEIVSRRAVTRWHDAVACTIV